MGGYISTLITYAENSMTQSHQKGGPVQLPNEQWKSIMLYSDAQSVLHLHDLSENLRNIANRLTKPELDIINANAESKEQQRLLFRTENGSLRSITTVPQQQFNMAEVGPISPDELNYLARHADHRKVRYAAVCRGSLTVETLEHAAKHDHDWRVRTAAVNSRRLTDDTLDYVAMHDKHYEVRLAAIRVGHLHLPIATLEHIARNDISWRVRVYAKSFLNQ